MTAGLFVDRHQTAWGVEMPLHSRSAVLTFRRVTTWKEQVKAKTHVNCSFFVAKVARIYIIQ